MSDLEWNEGEETVWYAQGNRSYWRIDEEGLNTPTPTYELSVQGWTERIIMARRSSMQEVKDLAQALQNSLDFEGRFDFDKATDA